MNSKYPDPAQVWQRVHPTGTGEPQTLQGLLQQLAQDRAFLQRTLGDVPLTREYADQSSCLKGILILSGGRPPRNIPNSGKSLTLGRCYDHALQRLSAYQLRSADPVYGPVFRQLAQQTQRHCQLIVESIGRT